MTTKHHYTVRHATPSISDYLRLRAGAGLSVRTPDAAVRGLANTLFAVQVMLGEHAIGMGRVVGDGGCFYQVVDIAVLPEHQGCGLGKMIMREIADYIEWEVPESGYVSLLADGRAHELYQQFGFVFTAPASVGMALRKTGRDDG